MAEKSSSGSSGQGRSASQKKSGDTNPETVRQRDAATTAGVTEDSEGVRKDPDGTLVPEENAPGPEPVEAPTITAVDLRPRIEPRDRATYLGAIHTRHPDIDVPEDFQMFGDSDGERDAETVELDGKPVDVFQVIGTNHNIVFRFDGQTFVLDSEQSRGLSVDLHGVLGNVVT